jgi:hypothetical protein
MMIAVHSARSSLDAERSASFGSGSFGPSSDDNGSADSPAREAASFVPAIRTERVSSAPEGAEPSVVAVVINPAAYRASAFAVEPQNPQAVLQELVAVLERHFGDRVRVADWVVSSTAGASAEADMTPEPAHHEPPLTYGRLTIDFAQHEVTVDGRQAALTKSEFDLLAILAKRPGVVLSRREIVVASKGPNYPVDDRSIDVQMFNLRRKLGPVGRNLQTIRSVGYRFKPEGT